MFVKKKISVSNIMDLFICIYSYMARVCSYTFSVNVALFDLKWVCHFYSKKKIYDILWMFQIFWYSIVDKFKMYITFILNVLIYTYIPTKFDTNSFANNVDYNLVFFYPSYPAVLRYHSFVLTRFVMYSTVHIFFFFFLTGI